jgi:glycine cleavage system H protein
MEERANVMAYPAKYRYTREHEWIDADGKLGTVGITEHAQDSLGDIVFVELPKVGEKVEKGKVFGSVESVKAVSDLFAPASGTVTAVNEELTTAPEKINADAHAAWIMKIELSDPADLESLLTAADYETYTKEESGH